SVTRRETVSTVIQKNEVPRIAISATGLDGTWRTGHVGPKPGGGGTAFPQRARGGGGWTSYPPLGGPSHGSYHTSSVAVSSTGNPVHLIWADTTQDPSGSMFYSRLQATGQWTAPRRISTGAEFGHFPHSTVDAAGRIWAVWSAEMPSGTDNVFYRVSSDNGLTWQPQADGRLDSNNAKRPRIAPDRTGGVHAVWSARGVLKYGRWSGRWSVASVPISGYNTDPSVTVDDTDNGHVVWRRQRG